MNIPDELTHDDHVVIGGPQGSHRFEISIEECTHSPGVLVKGFTPPGHAPRVVEAEAPGAYTVHKSGSPEFFVDVRERVCNCEARDRGSWCLHLRVATVYHNRRDEHDDRDDGRGGGGGGDHDGGNGGSGASEDEIEARIDDIIRVKDREFESEEQEAEHRETLRSYFTGGDE